MERDMESRAAQDEGMASGARLTPRVHVVAAGQGGRTVLLDVERGRYHTLDEVGGRIWRLLGEGADVDAIVDALGREYDVERARLEADVAALLRQLRDAGLVE
jgi:hypothetical protein